MAKPLTVQSVERFKPDPTKRQEIADGLLPSLYFVLQPSGVRSWRSATARAANRESWRSCKS
jgi:hypothetical protein